MIRNFQDVIERDTTFNVAFTKDKPCFNMHRAFCPHCGSYEVVKNGFTYRELVFMDSGRTKVSVQRYKCKSCNKSFQTDLTSIVDKNSNFYT